jgi:hypothetical protein
MSCKLNLETGVAFFATPICISVELEVDKTVAENKRGKKSNKEQWNGALVVAATVNGVARVDSADVAVIAVALVGDVEALANSLVIAVETESSHVKSVCWQTPCSSQVSSVQEMPSSESFS